MKKFNKTVCVESKAFAVLMAAMPAWAFADAQATDPGGHSKLVYVAHLHVMNSKVTGLPTSGEARFSIVGDELTISVTALGVPPNLAHWQHFHGFADNRAANCPGAAADVNGDGIIDLIETEPAAGTTMVPFTDNPLAMDVAHGTYPKASGAATYTYRQTVSLKGLTAAFTKAFNDPTPISTGGWFSSTASWRPANCLRPWPHSARFRRTSRCRSPAAELNESNAEQRFGCGARRLVE